MQETDREAWSRSAKAKMASCTQGQSVRGSGTVWGSRWLNRPLNGCCELFRSDFGAALAWTAMPL